MATFRATAHEFPRERAVSGPDVHNVRALREQPDYRVSQSPHSPPGDVTVMECADESPPALSASHTQWITLATPQPKNAQEEAREKSLEAKRREGDSGMTQRIVWA